MSTREIPYEGQCITIAVHWSEKKDAVWTRLFYEDFPHPAEPEQLARAICKAKEHIDAYNRKTAGDEAIIADALAIAEEYENL